MSSDSILREQAVQSPCPETSPQSRNLAGSGTFACIPSPPDLEKLLPNYYRTAKLASFQRQLNNFGYHRVGWTPARGAQQPQGLKYHKVVGEATTRTESLLELRPLSRRKRERAPAPAPRRRNARAEPLKRARTESDANAAMLLLSCMRREDSLPALGEPIAA